MAPWRHNSTSTFVGIPRALFLITIKKGKIMICSVPRLQEHKHTPDFEYEYELFLEFVKKKYKPGFSALNFCKARGMLTKEMNDIYRTFTNLSICTLTECRNKAMGSYIEEDYTFSIRCLRWLERKGKASTVDFLNLALSYRAIFDYKKAIHYYQKCLRGKYRFEAQQALMDIADNLIFPIAERSLKDKLKLIDYQIEQIKLDNRVDEKPLLYFLFGKRELLLGNFYKAENCFLAALKYDPDYLSACEELSELYINHLDNNAKAEPYLARLKDKSLNVSLFLFDQHDTNTLGTVEDLTFLARKPMITNTIPEYKQDLSNPRWRKGLYVAYQGCLNDCYFERIESLDSWLKNNELTLEDLINLIKEFGK